METRGKTILRTKSTNQEIQKEEMRYNKKQDSENTGNTETRKQRTLIQGN